MARASGLLIQIKKNFRLEKIYEKLWKYAKIKEAQHQFFKKYIIEREEKQRKTKPYDGWWLVTDDTQQAKHGSKGAFMIDDWLTTTDRQWHTRPRKAIDRTHDAQQQTGHWKILKKILLKFQNRSTHTHDKKKMNEKKMKLIIILIINYFKRKGRLSASCGGKCSSAG